MMMRVSTPVMPMSRPRFGGSAVQSVDQASFQAEVLNAKEPVVVDFYGDWCPPCKRLAPMYEQMANEFKQAGKATKFVKVNVDQNPGLAQQFNVNSIPTLMVFKGGQKVSQFVGLPSKAYLQGFVDQNS